MIKSYYYLAKPGIIYGNLITAAAGFFLASKSHVNFGFLLATLAGIALVMASGCVFNNYMDRDIDSRMERTKNRALVNGSISGRNAIIYGIILGALGFLALYFYTNLLTVLVALGGFIFYVFIYTPLKRRTVHGTVLGSISGAVPPVVGYCAVTNHFDLGAVLLFVILVLWQMPHFYSIAIYRLDDYAAAGIPALPVKKGIPTTKIYMLCYIMAFILATALLTTFEYTGYAYLAIVVLVGLYWLRMCIQGFQAGNEDKLWARKMFKFSLNVLLVFSMLISIDAIIKI